MARKHIHYSPEVADRICALTAEGYTMAGVADQPGMPRRNTMNLWMKARPELAARVREARARRTILKRRTTRPDRPVPPTAVYSQALAEAICDRLAEGRAVREVAAEPGMPSTSRIYVWLDRRPEFARMFAWACEMRCDALAEEIMDKPTPAWTRGAWPPARPAPPPPPAKPSITPA